MIDQNTKIFLKDLKIPELADIVERQETIADFTTMDFISRLQFAIHDLHAQKMDERNRQRIKNATFKYPDADICKIIYNEERGLDRTAISNLGTSNYINHNTNVALIGTTGCGKSYLACALGVGACNLGLRVKFYRMPDLIADFNCIETPLQKKRLLRLLANYDLLILDEWLSLKPNVEQKEFIFEIIEKRECMHSTIFCSQYDIPEWYDRFGEEAITTTESILSRIVHSTVKINFGNYSMRKYYAPLHTVY